MVKPELQAIIWDMDGVLAYTNETTTHDSIELGMADWVIDDFSEVPPQTLLDMVALREAADDTSM